MSAITLADAIALEGGVADPDDLPPGVSPALLDATLATVAVCGAGFEAVMDRAGRRVMGAVVVTRSTGFGCRVRPVQGGTAILLPLGVPARLWTLARLLLGYWGDERRVLVIQSLLDDLPWNRGVIPPALEPLFLEDLAEQEFWESLRALDESIPASRFDQDAFELLHLATQFLLAHEFTHLVHGHFELLERAQREDVGMTREEIRRGIEIDADDSAAAISMLLLKDAVERARAMGQEADIELGWLRLAYAVTMLFGIMDTHRRFLGAYDTGAYSHPAVRCELFAQAVDRCLDAPEDLRKLWRAHNTDGWSRCVFAFEDLNLDAMAGKFGERAKAESTRAIHNLAYGAGPTWQVILDRLVEAEGLARRVRALLPVFAGPREEQA